MMTRRQHAHRSGGRRAAHLADALHTAAALGASKDLTDRLCVAATVALDGQGASVCVLFAPGMSVPVGVSDAVAEHAEELQFTAGEGPCWQAYASRSVVVVDFADAAAVRRHWPVYAPAMMREVGYGCVVAVPVRLGSGLQVVLNVYEASLPADEWWICAEVVAAALREVLEDASTPASVPGGAAVWVGEAEGAEADEVKVEEAEVVGAGGAAWLDSSSTVRRGMVWSAEAMLLDQVPALQHVQALRALRMFSAVQGVTVDAAAAALVQGRLTVAEVLGDA